MYLLKIHPWIICMLLFFPAAFTQAQLTIQSGAVLSASGNALITLQTMDLINNGVFSLAGGDSRLVFTGSGDNSISGNGHPVFDRLEIAKTGQARVSLAQDIEIAGGIDFTSGLIDLNGHTILLEPAALLNGEKESSRITGLTGGYIQIASILNTPSGANPGNLGILITSAQNMGNTIIRRGNMSQTNISATGSSILRYYDIAPANNTGLNATLRIYYQDGELNHNEEAGLVLWKSTDSVHWTNMGFTGRDTIAHYVERTGIADFSRWTLASLANPLPILFESFTLQCVNGLALISWKTAREENSSRFDVQNSADGLTWQTVARLPAAGNSDSERSYSCTDDHSAAAKPLYRLAEYDLDGSVTYSGIASLSCGVNNNDINIRPNPVKDLLWVSLNMGAASTLKMEFLDGKGARVHEQITSLVGGSNQMNVNMTRLPSGVYYLLLEWNDGSNRKTIKVLKE